MEDNIDAFHKTRFDNIQKLKLNTILKRKNPYLFKAKHVVTAADLVKSIVDAHLSSGEETLFGDFLEGLAIYICAKIYGGVKSSANGIDLEFGRDQIRYLVSIKSGPNWGNSRQISKMKDDFNKAIRILRTSKSNVDVRAVNGCCYGKDDNPDKGTYYKYCGQRFWEFISGDNELYTKIIEPLGFKAKEKNEQFNEEYARVLNTFTALFISDFCENGIIDWNKLVAYNSASK
jgi:hypothetical protein